MLLRTEILHDFDTVSPTPHVSFKKREREKKKKRLAYPRISNFLGIDGGLGGLEFVFRPLSFPERRPSSERLGLLDAPLRH